MISKLLFISHPEVAIDPLVPVERWRLSEDGTRRMRQFADSTVVQNVRAVWASSESKAIEGAGILAARLGIGIQVEHDLHENDRSATGFLPPNEFEQVANAFFAHPEASVRGWERALDAQRRIRRTVETILACPQDGDLAVVGHGGVGTLLLCSYRNVEISRVHDQPFQGHFWTLDRKALAVEHGWLPIAPRL